MYVCICNAVTEKDIHKAVKQGVSSIEQLSEQTSVSLRCGSCQSRACKVLETALSNSCVN
ncbi:(2Fe-2S)-binding protein [Cyanobacterium stanieri LEGE 03274]|uniref:Bacterioferritin-associated ferredoxin n=1 Tax=Cyanobacterium stanieri LEGE 03274 TaxID=1828756 RepID=A0ABR9V173_9CHRO|nr:(2Fe-2S)-binding protein [Cyanobacterium stanieri]MBE9221635.1 (2Fe-2S)-binding protein [Cyanobacterium stanieri LEGE 03274]